MPVKYSPYKIRIAACLGMYLPTFTNVGMITGDEFRDSDIHRRSVNYQNKEFGSKQLCLLAPKKQYAPHQQVIEVVPLKPDNKWLLEQLSNDKSYDKRLESLKSIQETSVFTVEALANKVKEECIYPLFNTSELKSMLK